MLDAGRAADDLTESGGPVRVGSSDIGYLILDIYIGLFQVVSSCFRLFQVVSGCW